MRPTRTGWTPCSRPRLALQHGRDRGYRRPCQPGRPGDGGAERALLPGLAGGLPAHRPPWRSGPRTRRSRRSSTRCSPSTPSGSSSASEQPWRRPLPSLNVLLTSHVWRQDHNGYSHQAPGFSTMRSSRRARSCAPTFPPDGNCLLSIFEHCLRSRNYVNLVTCGKQWALQWLTMDEARDHCARGASRWAFASNDDGRRARTSSWPARATCPRSRRARPPGCCASTRRRSASASSTSSISEW